MSARMWLPKTIRGGFALFALSLALPLVALIGYGLYDRAREEFAAAEDEARLLAESNADRTAQYVASVRGALEALARRPLVRAMDATRCEPRLGDLVELYPRAASLIVVNLDGVIICSSNPLPRDRVVRVVDVELLAEMRTTPRFLVSKPVKNRFDGRWIVSAVQPVTAENGALIGTVAMATDLLRWRPFPPPEALPAGAIVTVVTSDGTIIARSVDTEKWVSRKVWDERLLKLIVAGKEAVVRAKGADDVDRVFGVSAVAGLPWFVLAGLPEESVFAPARARLAETGAILALVIGGVLVLAWVFVARLVKPITAIAAAVRERSEGNDEVKIPVAGPVEVARVALELNRMIESGARATAELGRQAKRLGIIHDIDRAIIAEAKPESIAMATLQPLRKLLEVSRVNINMIDYAAGEVEWLAAAGRHRTHVGSGVRFSMQLLGDVEALRRGESQTIDTQALPQSPERDALLASGVRHYMAVPMIAGGELIGALSFGDERGMFPEERVLIAGEVAMQLAIAITQARLFERVKRQAEELEQRVRERTAELEAANKELEAFSYSVSHDLRAPLRAIDGFSRIVEEDYAGKLDDEGRRLLGVIRDNSRKMAQLIDDLLEYSHLGRKPLSTEEIDMQRLVEEVFGDLQASGGRPPRLVLAALPPARGDATLLKQVWTNLLANAIKFSGKREQSVIQVSGNENGTENVYCVKDNGAGFDKHYGEKLFKVFQRLHREEEFEGTGVGLAIVQRVVSRHGGRVWAEGKVEEGAAFYFSLPRGKPDGPTNELGQKRKQLVAQ